MAKIEKERYKCVSCGNKYIETNFYRSYSVFFAGIGKMPVCKQCVEKHYQYYYGVYVNMGSLTPEKDAVKRVCEALDIYYLDKVFNSAMDLFNKKDSNYSPMSAYMKNVQLKPYNDRTYDATISENKKEEFIIETPEDISSSIGIDEKTMEFFGYGYNGKDYKFLKNQYDDWTSRHECNTKSQEENFKEICFTQWEIHKARLRGDDTKNLVDTLLKLTDAAKLQPKQSKGDTTAETQTFGTLIDKWENTRPLPEVSEELKDVDNLMKLIRVFYTGHMAKALNINLDLMDEYDEYIKEYTVKKRKYNDDTNNEALFDKVFGKKNIDVDE